MHQLSLKPLTRPEIKGTVPLQSNVLLIRVKQNKYVLRVVLFSPLAGKKQCFIQQIRFITAQLAYRFQVLDR